MTIPRDEFVSNLRASRLFPEAELSRLLRGVSAADGDALASDLIAAGHLTPHQANAISRQQFNNLRIGNYDILARLGEGGMGAVYKARHRRMKRLVALKVLSDESAQSELFVQRFTRECEAMACLQHPNIVMAFDAGESEAGPFLVMEFVKGRDLDSEVLENGPLCGADAVRYVVQAARGLAYAHEHGIVHRDVKPGNLLLDESGVVKVADLGLARLSEGYQGETAVRLTQAGWFVGTLAFMAPEQAYSAAVDHRADIYSLGCTLHFLLTGRPPYEVPSPMALVLKHTTAPIPSLRSLRPDLPDDLDAVYQRMLAKTPAERYQSMEEVIGALEAVQGLTDLHPTMVLPPLPVSPEDNTLTVASRRVAAGSTPRPTPAPQGVTVVIAEPSRVQAGIIRKYLQPPAAEEVWVASSGREALELVVEKKPAILLCSMHLPDMTAVDLARLLRADPVGAGVGLLVVTSQSDASRNADLQPIDRKVVLYKPFDQPQLLRAIVLVTGQASAKTPGALADRVDHLQVLIVDDSSAARAHERSVLSNLGIRNLTESKDGLEAANALDQKRFDLIVTDYNMPNVNGLELIRLIRRKKECSTVPILMVTSETDPMLHEQVLREGAAAVCEKSFKPEVVRRLLTRLLGESP